jgi:pilus assembly protein Flp/PilA
MDRFGCNVRGAMPTPLGRQAGQGMVEYALILVMVAIVVIVMLIAEGGTTVNLFSDITNSLHTDAHI